MIVGSDRDKKDIEHINTTFLLLRLAYVVVSSSKTTQQPQFFIRHKKVKRNKKNLASGSHEKLQLCRGCKDSENCKTT